MFVRKTLHFPLSAALFLSLIGSATAQSLKVNAPAHLAAGVNHATVDSFVGDHYWDFYVNPGKFQLVFAGSDPEEGFSVGGAPQVAIAFVPKTPGAVFTQRAARGGGVVFSGSVSQRTRVGIVVEPAKSPLVRQTTGYTLTATGNIDFQSAAAAGPSVVGGYAVKSGFTSNYGVAKLTADGNIVTTSGVDGTWKLFDADSRTYVVTIGRDRVSLIFQPGRGFIDAGNQNLTLEMRH